MTPANRLRAALDAIRWSGHLLGRLLRVDERTVRRWLAGQYPVPDDVLAWLETLAAFHQRHPPPGR